MGNGALGETSQVARKHVEQELEEDHVHAQVQLFLEMAKIVLVHPWRQKFVILTSVL